MSGCVRVSGEKNRSLPKAPFAPCVCMCVCTFMCTHMWSRVHLCVGRRNPSSRFLSWASSCVPPAHNSQSRHRRVWPRQDPTHQRRRRSRASVSLPPPPSSVCFHRSLNVTINPAHTHTHTHMCTHIPASLHPVCVGVSHMTWQKLTLHRCVPVQECVLRVLAVFSMQLYQKILWEMWF